MRRSGCGLSLEGQQMLQKLLHETSERYSRGAKKKAIKGKHLALKECSRTCVSDIIIRFFRCAVVSRRKAARRIIGEGRENGTGVKAAFELTLEGLLTVDKSEGADTCWLGRATCNPCLLLLLRREGTSLSHTIVPVFRQQSCF
jgi:hypothetical protein